MSTDKPTTARLVGFHVRADHPLPPPLQHVGLVRVDDPPGNLAGWGVEVRGSTMFLISPPGWKTGLAPAQWRKDGDRTFFGPISLVNVTLIWQGASADAVDKAQRYSLPEMRAVRATTAEGPAIPPSQMGDP